VDGLKLKHSIEPRFRIQEHQRRERFNRVMLFDESDLWRTRRRPAPRL